MGNEISSADEARPGLFTPSATNPNPLRVIDSPNTCESYRTLNSHRTSSASPVKRRDRESNGSKRSVSKLVAKFEQYDVTDGRGSVISSQSGSTDIGEQPDELRSSSSSLGRGEKLSQTQKQEKKT